MPKNTRLHRWNGYVAACSLILSVGGAISIMFHSEAGAVSFFALALLSILWTVCLLIGINHARQKRTQSHKYWMWRTYALTFSAVMLRVYHRLFTLFGANPIDAYMWAQWCALVLNIVCAEVLIYLQGKKALLLTEGG